MKLAAWRDAIDRDDARLLLSKIEGSPEEVWARIEAYVPGAFRDKASYALDISGIRLMDLRSLVEAVLGGDLLTARQWVSDARRERVRWSTLPLPHDLSDRQLTVAAALVELFAQRAGEQPPPWSGTVGGEREPIVLDPGLEEMPRSFALAKAAGPEPLRRRNLVALPDFLEVA